MMITENNFDYILKLIIINKTTVYNIIYKNDIVVGLEQKFVALFLSEIQRQF